jgi:endonuclease/exonuclease/phosphatase (EEP) superfamily protein YafD
VYTKNKEWSKFIALIETENPNIIVTQEVNNKWINHLSVIEKKYPFNVKLPRSDNFGMAVYSKFPIVKKVDLTTDRFAIPTISITIQIENKNIEIISMHPLPPINNEYFNSRNKQINFIANYCKNAETPIILIGDLNTSLWSKYYTHLENLSKLHNTRRGFGILPSWPANIFPFRIPIDHCMVSPEFDVINTKLGTNINSDHLPLIVTLKF